MGSIAGALHVREFLVAESTGDDSPSVPKRQSRAFSRFFPSRVTTVPPSAETTEGFIATPDGSSM